MSRSSRTLLTPAATVKWLRQSNDLLADIMVALASAAPKSGRRRGGGKAPGKTKPAKRKSAT